MRHYKKGRKLGSSASHTAAIKKNLMVNLFMNDRIKTTLERAKEIRGDVDKVITWAKRGDVHSRRLAIAKLGDKELVAEIFAKVEQGLFKDRPGGYTRIYKVGKRRGDDAIIALMELVQEPVQFKKKAADADEKAAPKVDKKAKKAKKETDADEAAEEVTEAAEEAVEETVDEAADAANEAEEAPAAEDAATEEETPATDETPVDVTAEEAPAEDAPAEEAPAEDESDK